MRTRVLAATATALVVFSLNAGIASANAGDVIRRGTCSVASTWKLKLSPENGQVETELQIDENVVGHQWRVRLYQDGMLVATVLRTTQAPSGAFTVRRLLPDTTGDDVIRARARNLVTDELCVARAVLPA